MKKIKIPYQLIKQSQLKTLNETIELKTSAIFNATNFIKEIEKGNLEIEIKCSEQDELASSIASMRDQIKKISLEEKERNWATEGMAKFVEILRTNNDDMKTLADDIVINLVKYLNANQGALFMLNDESNSNEPYLEMTSCYAYDRKKFLEKKVCLGEGLVGQAFLEKETTYLKEIPQNYINITSGLGKALPKNILLVPLKINEEVYGIVEIASFNAILPYQISFVERLGESIASTISSVKVNQKTKSLLQESQAQTEELKSQEEEVRQNMEELSATQEEMQRILNEVQANEAFMKDLMNATNDSIITIDKNYKIISVNKSTTETYKSSGLKIEKGFDIFLLFTEEQKPKFRTYFERALKGESFEATENYKYGDKEQYFSVTYAPLRNQTDEIIGAASFGKDITESVLSKLKTEELLNEAQAQSEELKAQEEVLKQNMEEITATQEEMEKVLHEVKRNEAFLKDLMNATNDSITTIDTNYKVISCNQATLNMFKIAELKKGTDILSFYSDEKEKEKVKALYDRALNGESFEVTDKFVLDGSEVYINFSYNPLRNERKEIIGLASFGKNVTAAVKAKQNVDELLEESQQQNEEMKAQEEEFRQNMEELAATQEEMESIMKASQEKEFFATEVLNASHDSIVTIDKEFRVISFNKTFSDSLKVQGMTVAKGFNIMDIFPPEVHQEKKKLYKNVLAGEAIEQIDRFNHNGVDKYYQVHHTPIKNQQGEIIAISVCAEDITEMVEMKNQANKQERKK